MWFRNFTLFHFGVRFSMLVFSNCLGGGSSPREKRLASGKEVWKSRRPWKSRGFGRAGVVARQGLWKGRGCGRARAVEGQGLWKSRGCGRAGALAKQGLWKSRGCGSAKLQGQGLWREGLWKGRACGRAGCVEGQGLWGGKVYGRAKAVEGQSHTQQTKTSEAQHQLQRQSQPAKAASTHVLSVLSFAHVVHTCSKHQKHNTNFRGNHSQQRQHQPMCCQLFHLHMLYIFATFPRLKCPSISFVLEVLEAMLASDHQLQHIPLAERRGTERVIMRRNGTIMIVTPFHRLPDPMVTNNRGGLAVLEPPHGSEDQSLIH